MSIIRIYFVSICIILIAATYSPTVAYFSDSEDSLFNVFMATLLDGEVEGGPFEGDICALGGEVVTEFSFKNVGAIPFTYSIEVPEIADDMKDVCNVMNLTAKKNGDVFYIGLIESFSAADLPLSVDEMDVWELTASFADGVPDYVVDNKICEFDTVFTATQLGFMGTDAFSDIETLHHSIQGVAPIIGENGEIIINIENDATVTNNATTTSNTGGNTTVGGDGDEGDGGDAETNTGDASATTTVTNVVNETNIIVESTCSVCGQTTITTCTTGCTSTRGSTTTIRSNSTIINNIINTEENTGEETNVSEPEPDLEPEEEVVHVSEEIVEES